MISVELGKLSYKSAEILSKVDCQTCKYVSEIILKSQVWLTNLSYDKCRIEQIELQKCRNIK